MYAPVVTGLRTYGVTVDSDTDAYCKAILPCGDEGMDRRGQERALADPGLRVPVKLRKLWKPV